MAPSRQLFHTFAVVDSFLPDHIFREVAAFVEHAKYHPTPSGTSIWHSVEQENPSEGIDTFAWACPAVLSALPPQGRDAMLASAGILLHPSHTIIDHVIEAVCQEADLSASLLGARGTDWLGLLASAFKYHTGARATWHNDENEYRGAFIYYVHENWERSWGGELMIGDDTAKVGDGVFVLPVPNRLVILKGGTPHSVASVSIRSGGRARTSVAGFFVTEALSRKLISALRPPTGDHPQHEDDVVVSGKSI